MVIVRMSLCVVKSKGRFAAGGSRKVDLLPVNSKVDSLLMKSGGRFAVIGIV